MPEATGGLLQNTVTAITEYLKLDSYIISEFTDSVRSEVVIYNEPLERVIEIQDNAISVFHTNSLEPGETGISFDEVIEGIIYFNASVLDENYQTAINKIEKYLDSIKITLNENPNLQSTSYSNGTVEGFKWGKRFQVKPDEDILIHIGYQVLKVYYAPHIIERM